MAPFFSIILPTYNRASFLPTAIESVLNQGFKKWELIIIDDGSTDNTFKILSNYKDTRIKFFFQGNQGRSAARNLGVGFATGRYICFLDSDDYFKDFFLERLFLFISSNSFPQGLIFSDLILEENGHQEFISYLPPQEKTLEYLLNNTIGTIQVCLPFELARQFQFNRALCIGEDLELFMRIGDNFPLFYIPTGGVVARIHSERSVNKLRFNPGLGQLQSYRVIFKNNKKQKEKISRNKQNELTSNALASVGFHYLFNNQKGYSLKFLFFSIIRKPNHRQFKFRLYAILAQLPLFSVFFKKDTVSSSIS